MGVQAVCLELLGPTFSHHFPENRGFLLVEMQGGGVPLDPLLVRNLSTHLKNAAMGDSGSWRVTPGVV